MRNLVFLNGDGMINVAPNKSTVQINDDWYCEMNEEEFQAYCEEKDIRCNNYGELVDNEDDHKYGIVLVHG